MILNGKDLLKMWENQLVGFKLVTSNRMRPNSLGSFYRHLVKDLIFFVWRSIILGRYGDPTPCFFTARLRELKQRAAVAKIQVEVGSESPVIRFMSPYVESRIFSHMYMDILYVYGYT